MLESGSGVSVRGEALVALQRLDGTLAKGRQVLFAQLGQGEIGEQLPYEVLPQLDVALVEGVVVQLVVLQTHLLTAATGHVVHLPHVVDHTEGPHLRPQHGKVAARAAADLLHEVCELRAAVILLVGKEPDAVVLGEEGSPVVEGLPVGVAVCRATPRHPCNRDTGRRWRRSSAASP